jgi:HEAT repeat protein
MTLLLLGAACAGNEALRRLRGDVEDAAHRGDAAAGARRYLEHRAAGGADDGEALAALAVATLREGLHANDPAARLAAVQAAERFDVAELFDPVTQLLSDDVAVVRAAAAGAVVRGHPDAPAVLSAALADPDPAARALAVAALGRKVGEAAAADLRAALADDDAHVREAAVVALAPIDADAVATAARTDTEGPVRARALALCTRVAVLRAGIGDPYLGARLAAVDGLARVAGDEARPWLAPLATASSTSAERIVALHAAAVAGGLDAALAVAAASDYAPVRAAAANAVRADEGGAGPSRADEGAASRADQGAAGPSRADEGAASRAAEGAASPSRADEGAASPAAEVAASPSRAAAPAGLLDRLADDPEPTVRLAAARALVRVGRASDARPRLVAALELADPDLRLDAAGELARLGDTAPLSALAQDERPAVRRAALAAFPFGPPVPAPVVTALGDADRGVRVAAAAAILQRLH